jgi:hypothetical protein
METANKSEALFWDQLDSIIKDCETFDEFEARMEEFRFTDESVISDILRSEWDEYVAITHS